MIAKVYGPTHPISEQVHSEKHRQPDESFYDSACRLAGELKDSEAHRVVLKDIFLNQRFMAGGRVQAAVGSGRQITALNCYVDAPIVDSMDGIMDSVKRAARTMRMGGGDGFDFSTIRPKHSHIKGVGAKSSGPISFMPIWDSTCSSIRSAGNRRGAMMGVLRCDHPDIREFIHCKQEKGALEQFNLSVGVTDKFMKAVKNGGMFDLVFDGEVYETVNAKALFNEIMRMTFDWAEPGVLFLDRINEWNNLHYCEKITATNPCAEQPLPPNGACLLGSFNLVKYVVMKEGTYVFDWNLYRTDIAPVVRAMDNVLDIAIFPLEGQAKEAQDKRRMGLGITGLANAAEALGFPYGSPLFLEFQEEVLIILRDAAYTTSVDLAIEKDPFPKFEPEYLESKFIQTLPENIQNWIASHGIRNSHLLSIAPTGTISLGADNISSGIEPVFAYSTMRTIKEFEGSIIAEMPDYGVANFEVKGVRTKDVTVQQHLDVLLLAQKYVDSAVSKTCNVGDDVTWEEFKDIYMNAWLGGAKGITTFRAAGKRFGVLNSNDTKPEKEEDGAACYIDPATGSKTCD